MTALFDRVRAHRDQTRRRRDADANLRRGSQSARHAWRAAELTAPEHRLELAAELRAIADSAVVDQPALSPVPLNRAAARQHRHLLRRLATRLQELDRPLEPDVILDVEALLCDGASPLYAPAEGALLELTLDALLARIEVTP